MTDPLIVGVDVHRKNPTFSFMDASGVEGGPVYPWTIIALGHKRLSNS